MPEGTHKDSTSMPPPVAPPAAGSGTPEGPEKGGCGACTGNGCNGGTTSGTTVSHRTPAGAPLAGAALAGAPKAAEALAGARELAPKTPFDGPEGPLSSGDMARGCETTVRTVRFYEEAGLIEPVARSEGGHRMYSPEQLLKLQLIMDLREAGLSLQDIKSLFELKERCGNAEAASKQMADALEAQIACMQRKISVLRRLREELASMVATIRECEHCNAPDFKSRCDGCDVMARPDVPRAMRLLWGSCGSTKGSR